MNHSEVRKLLSAYVDGELEPDEASAVKEHVSRCEACAKYLEGLRILDESVRSTKPEAPAEGYFDFFSSKLRARIRSEEKRLTFGSRSEVRLARVRIAATGLVVLMAFGIGFIYGQREAPVRMVKLTPIPFVSDRTTIPHVIEMDEVVVSREEEVKAKHMAEAETPQEKEVPAARMESMRKDEDVSSPRGLGVRGEYLSYAAKKAESDVKVDAAATYAQANVAQLKGDYSSAVDGYGRVLESSPGTDLASAAQYQINVMRTDTSASVETLRNSAQLWKKYIAQYPRSSLTLGACNWYTESLYLIASRTKSRLDAEKALSAIEDCSRLIREKMPTDYRERASELRSYIRG